MSRESQIHFKIVGLNLPVKFFSYSLFFILSGLLYFGIFSTSLHSESPKRETISSNSIPNFQLKDQFGNEVSSRNLKNKNTVFAGCYPEDEEICRKIARKIYWKMQSFIYGKEQNYFFLGYIILNNSNPILAESLIPKYKTSGYESVYLDWKGILEKGSRKGTVHIRAVNAKGQLVMEDHWTKAENEDVKNLYKKLNK